MKIVLIFLLSAVALTATVSGALMIIYPGGSALNLPLSILSSTAFRDFSVPGWILLGVGTLHLFALFQYWQKSSSRFSWSLVAGILIAGWIVSQMILLAMVNWWQVVYLVAGILIIRISWQLKNRSIL